MELISGAGGGGGGVFFFQAEDGIRYRDVTGVQTCALPIYLSEDLTRHTGIDIQLQQRGGLFVCLSESELKNRQQMLEKMAAEHPQGYPFEVLDLQQLREMVPEIGPEVAGATWGPEDGHVNPLYLMRALVSRFESLGGKLVNAGQVRSEEHTSELQSHHDLVCRLLLEKKKHKKKKTKTSIQIA